MNYKGNDKANMVLREQAEKLLKDKSEDFPDNLRLQFEELVHELKVHQVELEMQNDELNLSRRQLELSRNKYLELYENAPVGYLVCDHKRVIVDANQTALEILGLRREGFVGKHCSMFTVLDDRRGFFRHIEDVFENDRRTVGEYRISTADSGVIDVEVHSSLIRDELYDHPFCLTAFFDISERKAMQKALRRSEERYRIVADYTYDWESWIGPEGEVLYVSPACRRISGYEREVFISNPGYMEEIICDEDVAAWRRFMREGSEEESFDFRIRHKEGGLRWASQTKRSVYDEDGKFLGIRYSIRDITRRKEMELQLRFQALHDPLTGLPNRTLCRDRIRHALERSRRRKRHSYSLVFLDMDKFKQINDKLGHEAGDKFLIEVGKRLLSCVRGLDTVSRFGGDEFVILLEELPSMKEGTRIVMRVLEALRKPFDLNGTEVHSSGSLGVALGAEGLDDPDELLRRANIAMHRAKEQGRDRYKVFNSRMYEAMQRVVDYGREMRNALGKNEFFFKMQPIIKLRNSEVLGFEMLARWEHPVRGVMNPIDFINIAEETGLIIDIGRHVLNTACRIGGNWLGREGRSSPLLCVNISGRELYDAGFPALLKEALAICGLKPRMLCLELSEFAVGKDEARALRRLENLKSLGVKLALDDFGVGASSINSLKKFPFDLLKIDNSLISNIDTGPAHLDSVKAIVELAHSLDMKVVAEGVSRKKQAEILRNIGCDYGQGFHFARPMSADHAGEVYEKGLQRAS